VSTGAPSHASHDADQRTARLYVPTPVGGSAAVGAAVAEAGHGLVAHRQKAKEGDERAARPRIQIQIVERAAKACPRVAACHRCAAPDLAAAVERWVDRLSLRAPFDHIVLDAVRDPSGVASRLRRATSCA
jgi:hypothetical protein